MKKLLTIIAILICVHHIVLSQDLKVEEMKVDASDISASTQRRLDAMNRPCALIKVYVLEDIQKVIGAIGDVVNKGSVKWVYVTEGSSQLTLGFDKNQAIRINFGDYGVTDIHSLGTYSLVISFKGKSQLNEVEKYRMGSSYEIQRDYKRAVELYKQAADNGFSEAQSRLALLYEKGWGVDKDEAKAFSYYLKAAEQGEPASQNNVGLYYIEGKGGVQRDPKKAIYWYTKAAESGDETAQSNLGYNYEVGDGVDKDISKAVYWYKKGAEGGNANAQNNYGRCLMEGLGIAKNVEEARSWFQMAADQGQLMAIFHLGYSYEVEGDFIHAIYWYKIAAEKGDSQSQANLAALYFQGQGVTKDLQKAFYWFEKAANQDLPDAVFFVGYMYLNGVGTAKNPRKAAELYIKAANLGVAAAQKMVGAMYENGAFLEKNLSKAIEWYRKAARQGDEEARQQLTRLGVK